MQVWLSHRQQPALTKLHADSWRPDAQAETPREGPLHNMVSRIYLHPECHLVF